MNSPRFTLATHGVRFAMVLAVVLFGWNLWANDLWAPDEPFFAEGAREMVVDGHWWVSHVNGEVNTHKPPFFFWLIALVSLPFEVSAFTARIPSFLAALGSLWMAMRLARRHWDSETAAWCGLLLTTTYMVWDKARVAQIDSTLCCLILVAISAFDVYRSGECKGWRSGAAFWTACALAVLAKGPVGLLVPLGICLVVLAWDRRLKSVLRPASLLGPLLFLAIGLAWAVPASIFVPDYSVWGALQEHAIDRAIHGMHHAQPPWYYATVIPHAWLPWSVLLPGALHAAWRTRDEPGSRLFFVMTVFPIVFFSISTEKRDLYILPAAPAMAILAARLVLLARDRGEAAAGIARTRVSRHWLRPPLGVIGFLFAVVGAGTPFLPDLLERPALRGPALIVAAVLGLGGAAMVVAAVRATNRGIVLTTVATISTAFLAAVTFVNPVLQPSKSARDLGGRVRALVSQAGPDMPKPHAIGLDNVLQAVNFYSDGVYFTQLETTEELDAEVRGGRVRVLLARRTHLEGLSPESRAQLRLVHATVLSRRNLELYAVDPVPAPGN